MKFKARTTGNTEVQLENEAGEVLLRYSLGPTEVECDTDKLLEAFVALAAKAAESQVFP